MYLNLHTLTIIVVENRVSSYMYKVHTNIYIYIVCKTVDWYTNKVYSGQRIVLEIVDYLNKVKSHLPISLLSTNTSNR